MFTFLTVIGTAAIAVIAAKLMFDGGSDSVTAWKKTWFWKILTFGNSQAKPGGIVHAFGTTILFGLDLLITAVIVVICAKFFGVVVGGMIGGIMALVVSLKFRKARRGLGKEKEGE